MNSRISKSRKRTQSMNIWFNYPEISDALCLPRLSCPGSLGPGHDCLWPLPSLQGGHIGVLQPIRRLGYNLSANQRAANWPLLQHYNCPMSSVWVKWGGRPSECLAMARSADDGNTWYSQSALALPPVSPAHGRVQLSLTTTATVNHSKTSFLIELFQTVILIVIIDEWIFVF